MKKLKTNIWCEKPMKENAFAPAKSYLHGQDYFQSVCPKCSYSENIFFHLRGNMPAEHESEWFDVLLNLAANPGIRDESSRVAMNVAIGQGPPANSVLAGLLARSGEDRGAKWIQQVMENLLKLEDGTIPSLDSCRRFSGLGLHFGSPDQRASIPASYLRNRGFWGKHSSRLLSESSDANPVLLEGLLAASLLDLGFNPITGALVVHFAAFPSLIAFSLEQWETGYKEYPGFFEAEAYIYTGPLPGKSEAEA